MNFKYVIQLEINNKSFNTLVSTYSEQASNTNIQA